MSIEFIDRHNYFYLYIHKFLLGFQRATIGATLTCRFEQLLRCLIRCNNSNLFIKKLGFKLQLLLPMMKLFKTVVYFVFKLLVFLEKLMFSLCQNVWVILLSCYGPCCHVKINQLLGLPHTSHLFH